jgi:hypothetical protein
LSIINSRNPDDSELTLDNTLARRLRWDAGKHPLDAGAHLETKPARRMTDLRKLSEWIQVQRQVAELKRKQP